MLFNIRQRPLQIVLFYHSLNINHCLAETKSSNHSDLVIAGSVRLVLILQDESRILKKQCFAFCKTDLEFCKTSLIFMLTRSCSQEI